MTDPAFVGRLRELAQLQKLLAEAADGRAVTAFLAGEAGVGKSRLLSEFADRARGGGAHVLRGACIELGGGVIPYAPLIESLRLLVRERGEAEVRALAGPAWTVLGGLISDFTGTDAEAEARPDARPGGQSRIFGAVLRLLDHLGRTAPVVLIFEDMHWADQSTLDLVSYLTRAKTTERAMLLCSRRSHLPPGHLLRMLLAEPDFRRRIDELELPGFTETELRQFLGELDKLGELDLDAARRGYELSDGNAFFAEQLMAAGALTDPGAGRIPQSINELMLARVGTLGPDANRVMRVAATAARRVDDRLLAAVCRLGEDALDEALHECLTRELLVDGPVEDTYVVRHALLREAVYDNMLPRERRRLHTEMAEAITADSALSLSDELSAAIELAHHWYAANRYSEALTAAVHAGEATTFKRAFHEAETQYKRALDLWDKVPEAARPSDVTHEQVLVAAADAARWSGHVEQAVGRVRKALAKTDERAEPRRTSELYERLGSFQWEAGDMTEARESYQKAERLLSVAGMQDAVYVRVLAGLATVEVQSGSFKTGLRQAQRAIELAGADDALAAKGRALNTAGIALTMLGKAQEGVPLLEEALRIARQADHLEDLFRAYSNLGVALEHTGDLEQAVEVAMDGLKHAHDLGLSGAMQTGVLANNAGFALMLLGRWDEAEKLVGEILLNHPLVAQSRYLRLTLAEIGVARGRFDKVEQLIGEVRNQNITDPRFTAALFTCEAELFSWRGEAERALRLVERGLAEIGDPEDELALLRLYAAGLRAAADRCAPHDDRAEPAEPANSPDPAIAAAAAAQSELWYARARESVDENSPLREVQVMLLLCGEERARALGTDTAVGWAEVASAWKELRRPYPVAYARWRQGAASLRAGDAEHATETAREADEVAGSLDAKPLRDEVARLLDALRTSEADVAAADAPDADADPQFGAAASSLTRRELQVFRLVCDGKGNREIGKQLGLAEGTVATHMNRIMTKFRVKSRTEAVVFANKTGFFDNLVTPTPTPDH